MRGLPQYHGGTDAGRCNYWDRGLFRGRKREKITHLKWEAKNVYHRCVWYEKIGVILEAHKYQISG